MEASPILDPLAEATALHRDLRGTPPTLTAVLATVEWYRDTMAHDADEVASADAMLDAVRDAIGDAVGWQGAAVAGRTEVLSRRGTTERGTVSVAATFGRSAHEGYEVLDGAPVGSPVSLANLVGEARQRATAAAWERDATRRERGEWLTPSQRKNLGRRKRAGK